jgi:hypothetical protein
VGSTRGIRYTLDLGKIDEAFVALLGISHAGYLTTKAAS